MSERTTLTLEQDVAELVAVEMHRTGQGKKAVVNDALRRGLHADARPDPVPFRVQARPMGLKAGQDLTSVSALLERLDGPVHR